MFGDPKNEIRVRLAPSPTGPLHLGTARTALFNWLFARKMEGRFILRIEDTDKERSLKKYEEGILEGLSWLGLDWDEGPEVMKHGVWNTKQERGEFGPYRQSERILIYQKYLERLLDEKKAYYCYCTKEELEAQRQAMIVEGLPPKYSGHCRSLVEPPVGREPQVIRFLTREGVVEFPDLIRGKVSFDSSLFGDMIIAKDLETPLYNFAVVVDDYEMKISHVIRGEDHLSNTPKQILMQVALGFGVPIYAHLPLILAADKSKLSKRYAETSLIDYRERGYLPQGVLNFMALLGWHPPGNQEIFDIHELIHEFDLRKVQKAGAVFDLTKLDWINGEHLKKMSIEKLLEDVKREVMQREYQAEDVFLRKVLESVRDRMKTLGDFIPLSEFFFELPHYEAKLLLWKEETFLSLRAKLEKILQIVKSIPSSDFSRDAIREQIEVLAGGNRGAFFWPLRAALTGLPSSPDPLIIAEILGKEEVIKRLELALSKITE